MQKLTIAEYCRKFGTADSTVRHRIKTGKLKSEVIDGLLHIVTNDDNVAPSSQDPLEAWVKTQKEEIQFLRQELQSVREEKDNQIKELHQLLAISERNVATLSEQNQLLLEDTRNQPSFFQRLRARFAS